MKKVVVKVLCPCFFKLGIEYLLHFFFAVKKSRAQFGRQSKLVSFMPAYQSFARSILTFESAIHPRRVKVSKPFGYKVIHHFLGQFYINVAKLSRCCQLRKTHHSEPEFLGVFSKNIFHLNPPSLVNYNSFARLIYSYCTT